jgi:hypothetical protein
MRRLVVCIVILLVGCGLSVVDRSQFDQRRMKTNNNVGYLSAENKTAMEDNPESAVKACERRLKGISKEEALAQCARFVQSGLPSGNPATERSSSPYYNNDPLTRDPWYP